MSYSVAIGLAAVTVVAACGQVAVAPSDGGAADASVVACTLETDDMPCGVTTCGDFGTCGGFDPGDVCDESGFQERSCTDKVCAGGACVDRARVDVQACNRDTDQIVCVSPGSCSETSCSFASTCSETAPDQIRTCTPKVCVAGACTGDGAPTEERLPCMRDTDTVVCGPESCRTLCDYQSICAESADGTIVCTPTRCVSGTCMPDPSGDTSVPAPPDACDRDTDGEFCGGGPCGTKCCTNGNCNFICEPEPC